MAPRRTTARKQTVRVSERGEPVVRKVLRAALVELAVSGYAQLKIDEVAARAGVNKTTIYRRWPTKEDLVRSLMLAMTQVRAAQPPDTGSLRSDLLELARQRAQALQSMEGRGVYRLLAADGANPEVKAIADAVQRLREMGPKIVLERALARGELSPDVNTEVFCDVLRAVTLSNLMTHGQALDEERFTAVLDVLLYGVLDRRIRRA